MKRIAFALAFVSFLLAGFVSCSKKLVSINTPSGRSLLLANTWQLAEVTEIVAGRQMPVYRRNAPANTEDFSLVRQSFKADGTVQYTDQFGHTGTDGEYELKQGGSKIRMALGGQDVVGEQVAMAPGHFEFTARISDQDAVKYRFEPAQ